MMNMTNIQQPPEQSQEPVKSTNSSAIKMISKPAVASKSRAVPILPKQVPPLVTRVVPLAPRPIVSAPEATTGLLKCEPNIITTSAGNTSITPVLSAVVSDAGCATLATPATPVTSAPLVTPLASTMSAAPTSSGMAAVPISSAVAAAPVSSAVAAAPVSSAMAAAPVSSAMAAAPVSSALAAAPATSVALASPTVAAGTQLSSDAAINNQSPSDEDEMKIASASSGPPSGTAGPTDKQRRLSRPRAFTEAEDLALIRFWGSNYDLYNRLSKLAFSRRAAEYLNNSLVTNVGITDRTPTHEKQVHNKICYLLRRYESVSKKYSSRRSKHNEGNLNASSNMLNMADAEFPYFSKMHAFMGDLLPVTTQERKRKALRYSSASLPAVVFPVSAHDMQETNGNSDAVVVGDKAGEKPAKTRRVEDNTPVCNNGEVNTNLSNEDEVLDGEDGDENENENGDNPKNMENTSEGTAAAGGTDVKEGVGEEGGEGGEEVGTAADEASNGDLDTGTDNGLEALQEGDREGRRQQSRKEYHLRREELSLRVRQESHLKAELDLRRRELDLRQRDFESRHHESLSRLEMQHVRELRESAKSFTDMGMTTYAQICMEKVATLLKL